MEILLIKSLYPEKQGIDFFRPTIGDEYIFIHFVTPVNLYHGEQVTKVLPGGCVFFERNKPQHFASPDCDLLHDWFHADVSFRKLLEKYDIQFNKVYYPEHSSDITHAVCEMELECMQRRSFYQAVVQATAEKMLAQLARAADHTQRTNLPPEKWEQLLEVRAQIHMQFDKDWTVEEMAQLANLSESRFYAVYKQAFGISPLKELCRIRTQRAQTLLLRDNCSVSEAAEYAGYKNLYHFIRQFKKITGVTPGQYKKQG
ncbi:MAG: AraC family transcriptional regulator [Clostridia bacterium]|nr:AraC family transcriptional regulator [Clostridia bacterium]